MDDAYLREHLLLGHEYSYKYDDWVHPLAEVLDGVTAQRALERARPDSKGIWDIVLHLALWNENIVNRVESGTKVRPAEADWPKPPSEADEAAWKSAQNRLWVSLDSVRKMLETTSMEAIRQSPYGLADLLVRFSHNAYHIGQIVKIREITD